MHFNKYTHQRQELDKKITSIHFITKQLEIPTAFLNRVLKSEVYEYVYAPEGFKSKTSVLKLNRAFYCLKESRNVWNDTFTDVSLKYNFIRTREKSSIFFVFVFIRFVGVGLENWPCYRIQFPCRAGVGGVFWLVYVPSIQFDLH